MGRRPATVVEEVKIALPRPRDIAIMESEPFNSYVRQLRKAIEASHAQ
jgi:ABC-type nitrate/sulfonate/bicarbonate transport system ATPase subunit